MEHSGSRDTRASPQFHGTRGRPPSSSGHAGVHISLMAGYIYIYIYQSSGWLSAWRLDIGGGVGRPPTPHVAGGVGRPPTPHVSNSGALPPSRFFHRGGHAPLPRGGVGRPPTPHVGYQPQGWLSALWLDIYMYINLKVGYQPRGWIYICLYIYLLSILYSEAARTLDIRWQSSDDYRHG
jgi:hypothetical protein